MCTIGQTASEAWRYCYQHITTRHGVFPGNKLCICNWLYSDDAHIHLWSVALRWVLLFQMFWWFPCAKNAGPDTGGLPEKRPAAFSLSLAANKHTYDTKINNTFSIQFVNLSPNLDLDYICIHLFLLQIIIKI